MPMNKLKEIKDFIDKEYINLKKSCLRARTQKGIDEKKRILNEELEEFTTTLNNLGNNVSTETYNKLTDDFVAVKTKVQLSIKILENSAVLPAKESYKKTSDYCIQVIIPKENKTVLDWEDILPLSSTLIDQEEEEQNNTTELSGTEIDQTTDSFEGHLENLKIRIQQDPIVTEAGRNNKEKMAALKIEDAMQLIPEFRGDPLELDQFIHAVNYCAKKIPENGEHTELLHVVLLKLKGPAAGHFKRIKGNKWEDVRECLKKEFGTDIKIEELTQKIETLEQDRQETFQQYKNRVLNIKERLEEFKAHKKEELDEDEFELKLLKQHFLAGLKNKNLKHLAKTQKDLCFEDLLDYLEQECIDDEQLEEVEKRLKNAKINSSPRRQQDYPPRKPFDSNPNRGYYNQRSWTNEHENYRRNERNPSPYRYNQQNPRNWNDNYRRYDRNPSPYRGNTNRNQNEYRNDRNFTNDRYSKNYDQNRDERFRNNTEHSRNMNNPRNVNFPREENYRNDHRERNRQFEQEGNSNWRNRDNDNYNRKN